MTASERKLERVSTISKSGRTIGSLYFVATAITVALMTASHRSVAAEVIQLSLPIDCETGRSCAIQSYVDHDSSSGAADYMCGTQTYDGHNGTDFRLLDLAAMRAGVNVMAAAEGTVLRSRDDMADILQPTPHATSIIGRECGNGLIIQHNDGWQTQYCHMARGSLQVKPGDHVGAGQPLGRVGLSGETSFPHLHLTVRHRGELVDPFAFELSEGRCNSGRSLWQTSLKKALTYRPRTVLNAGFAGGPVTEEQIESGDLGSSLEPNAGALVAYVRAIGLKRGDVLELTLKAPDGTTLVSQRREPLDHDKAQYLFFVGKKRTPAGWATGAYQASFSVSHDGQIVLVKVFEISI